MDPAPTLASSVGSARGRGERATAAVEFALVLPLVLTMTVAVLQVGLLVKDRLVLEGAARAGAREAAVTLDPDAVQAAVVAAAVSLDPSFIQVDIAREGGAGTPVTVRVDYEHRLSLMLVDWLFPESVSLSARAVMRQETQ